MGPQDYKSNISDSAKLRRSTQVSLNNRCPLTSGTTLLDNLNNKHKHFPLYNNVSWQTWAQDGSRTWNGNCCLLANFTALGKIMHTTPKLSIMNKYRILYNYSSCKFLSIPELMGLLNFIALFYYNSSAYTFLHQFIAAFCSSAPYLKQVVESRQQRVSRNWKTFLNFNFLTWQFFMTLCRCTVQFESWEWVCLFASTWIRLAQERRQGTFKHRQSPSKSSGP